MAIDLEIVTPDIDLGIFKKLLGEKTHFIYELVQNADDSKSNLLGLRLYKNELFVWNDGHPFSQEDVQSICSTGSSDKDLTQIGNFGIGFKSVYNYTDLPEIYSNDVCFRIPYLKKPEAIDMDPRVAELLDKNVTVVFRLPFKDSLLPEDITNLENHLYNLEKKRSLLFLRHLKTIQWYDKKNGQTGSYVCLRPDKPGNRFQVELRASLNNESQPSETFLVFRKKVQPQEYVIDRLQDQAEDWKEEDRIQRSREELQSIEVAFRLQDSKITTLDDCMLFAYLPTEIKTNLRFLIQARYQTTPSRENIVKPSESLWNRWLLQETANFLPEVLEQLKDCELLAPIFFNVLPLKEDNVREEFDLVVEALQKAMRERAFVPTEDGGYAKAETVFYPHRESLLQLIESSWLYPGSSWLHQDIGLSGHAFNVMKEAGVKEINVGHVLNWLEKQDLNWFENRCEKWLRSLYIYLNSQKSEVERIKKLPLVRLENGQHVCANNELVFFPPNTDEAREEIKPFLNNLPILQSTLLAGEKGNEIEAFLKSIGVKQLRRVDMILEGICPQYRKSTKPSPEENRLHVRYLFKVWNDVAESERNRLKKQISGIPILRSYKSQNSVVEFRYIKPCDAYLPQAYTGNADLETYFSVYNGDVWFVDSGYLENNSSREDWLQFLKAIGSIDTPRVIKKDVPVDYKECARRGILRTGTRAVEETIEDHYLYGLSDVLNQIREHKEMDVSRSLWCLLVKALPPAEKERDNFFQDTYQGSYCSRYRPHQRLHTDHFDAIFYRQLKETPWVPDEHGKLHKPSECYLPTSENRELLGDSVFYLPDSFTISTGTATWLAKQLDIHVKIDDEDVLKRLRDLSGTDVSVTQVEPLYCFLYDNRPRRKVESAFGIPGYMADSIPSWRQTFKEESLIFIPEPKPHWRSADEVFWEDESAVFESEYGYLKAHYKEPLRSFFTVSLEIPERADTLGYISGVRNVASTRRADGVARKRVEVLYGRLWQSLSEDSNWQEDKEWKQVREESCWIGKKGNEWEFFSPQELVWKDDDYRSELFKNEVPFWGLGNDLLEFAKELGIEGCYQDSHVKFYYCGNQEEDTDWAAKVRDLRENVRDFLHSPHLGGEREEEKSAEVLDRLSVRRVEKLEARFELKGIAVPDPNPRQSFLEETNQEAVLGLASEASESQYPWLIGDALQEYFGDVKELSAFVEDLLTKDKQNVLTRWKQKSLQTNEEDSKEDEQDLTAPVDDKLTNEFDSTDVDATVDESDVGIPMDDEDSDSVADGVDESEIHFSNDTGNDSTDDGSEHGTPEINENPGIGNGDPNSTTRDSGTKTYNPSGTSGTSRSGGHSLSPSSTKGSGGGGHGGSGGGGEGEEHENLKRDLANNPTQFGEGLELVKIEYTFGSGDRVDILLKDSSENPVTVEVETGFSYGTGRYVGVWQAVKYQHLAAMEYNLECRQVRSILAAPEIPDDVKEKCKELGIESFEVSQG